MKRIVFVAILIASMCGKWSTVYAQDLSLGPSDLGGTFNITLPSGGGSVTISVTSIPGESGPYWNPNLHAFNITPLAVIANEVKQSMNKRKMLTNDDIKDGFQCVLTCWNHPLYTETKK